MAECEDRCRVVTIIFYVIFTILCFIFIILEYTIEPKGKIRTEINSVLLILLISETVISILILNCKQIFFLYVLNIFIFIIEISLELYSQKYLPNNARFRDTKRIYNLLRFAK